MNDVKNKVIIIGLQTIIITCRTVFSITKSSIYFIHSLEDYILSFLTNSLEIESIELLVLDDDEWVIV